MVVKLKWNLLFLVAVLQSCVYGNSFRPRNPRRGDHYRDTRIAYACEDSTMFLNCSTQNGVIRIIRANYGRFVLSTCNPWSVTTGWNLQCSNRDSFRIVADRCDGRPSCNIVASNHVFQDPCESTHKYLEVYYYCEKTEATTTTTTSTSTTASTTSTTSTTTTTPRPTERPTPSPSGTTGCECDHRGTAQCIYETGVCTCKDNFTGPKCDQCAPGFYNFPFCAACNCDRRATLPEVCSTANGECFCGPNLTPTCDACLPGFVNYPFCQVDLATTRAPTTSKPTDTSPIEIKRTTDPHSRRTTTTLAPNPMYTCKARDAEGVWWPASRPGLVYRDCPGDLKGQMSWVCGGRGWIRRPNLSNCVSPWLDNFEDLINKRKCDRCHPLDTNCRPIKCPPGIDASTVNVEDVATTLHERTVSTRFSPGDLKKTALDLFPKLNRRLEDQIRDLPKRQRREKVDKYAQSVLKSGSNLLTDSNSWKGLPLKERRRVATSLVVNIDETGNHIANTLDVGDPPVVKRDENIFMEVNAVNTRFAEDRKLQFPSAVEDSQRSGDVVSIPIRSLLNSSANGDVKVVFLIYQNLNEFMSPGPKRDSSDNAETVNNDLDMKVENETDPFIGTNIFSASVNGRKTQMQLLQPMVFTMKHKQPVPSGFHPVCSFWKFNESLEGEWSADGCRLLHTNQSFTTCQCDHMTNFAVLMDVVGTELTPEHQISLTAITYFGCIVSICCLLCCIFTFCFFRNLQCDRNTIHKNLCLSLMLAEIVFLVGINLTAFPVVCAVVAGLLHFLFLASFSWMCLEGVQLYVMLVEVFEAERSRRLWYYLFGYGVPSVIVGISAGIHHEGYGTANHCWLKTENYFIWSFVGPAIGVMVVNVGMLGLAIYMMCRHSNTLASSLQTKEKTRLQKVNGDPNSGSSSGSASTREKSNLNANIPSWIKGAVVLVVLLGLTWAFGVLFINQDSIVMAYIFTILNTFQGVFIFIFHCVMNEKVKKEYKKYAYRSTWLPGCIRSAFTGYSGTSSTSPNSTSSGGNLLKFWSGRRRRKSSGSTLEKAGKGKKRRSDLRSSDLESFSNISSSMSNHGNAYHSYNRPTSNPYGNGYTHGYSYSNNAANGGGGIAGDLSIAECSVVDSEYVTEYCHNNMQVSMEKRDYESGSEDETVHDNHDNKNRLSVLSEDSAVKNSDFQSTEAEHSCSELSDDENEKSKGVPNEMVPLVPKTDTDNVLLNNIVTPKSDSQNNIPLSMNLNEINTSRDHLSRSTPNMKQIEGYEALLDTSDVLLIEEEGDRSHGRKPVIRLSSDCQVKPDPHQYSLELSEC